MALGLEEDIPYPFVRELTYQADDIAEGKDIFILQQLLRRWGGASKLEVTSKYDLPTSQAVANFKVYKSIKDDKPNTMLSVEAARVIMAELSEDGFRWDGRPAQEYNQQYGLDFKFLLHIPVFANRSIESLASLYSGNGTHLHSFPVRTHGQTKPGKGEWPEYDNSIGLTSFYSGGSTPTGMSLVDYNTPEPAAYVNEYGEWNVLRVVRGLQGNAEFLIPNVRSGILVHTGRWPYWSSGKTMPNSQGCVHTWPEHQKIYTEILSSIGVIANENPLGQLPYPFQPQGLIVVEGY